MKHTHKHFFAACAAAVSMAFAAMPVYAEETAPQGYVTIAVEKFTTGEGYILEPVAVPFFAGDTGAELTERALGAEQINEGAGMGTYIASIADPEGGTGTVPEVIRNAVAAAGGTLEMQRLTPGWLASYDYASTGGWMYLLNNEVPTFGIGDYIPQDGDVLRWSFSIYAYGADLGIDTSYMAEWGGAAAITPAANRDALTGLLAGAKDSQDTGVQAAYAAALAVVSDVTAEQVRLDEAAAALQAVLDAAPAGTTVTETVTTGEASGETTVTSAGEATAPAPATGAHGGWLVLTGTGLLALAAVCARKRHA
ncbi:DUF4430 domain-containing protein [Ruminococcus sp.]|uniref:DUF4430 domain-containing protein n=1 Tax=Ruminococcus sp. TaxID=41978 RepID=UPI00260D6963|nr:DUF4430 domain-containing protein [Ruminococcus sp.]MDD7555642.1 DUF4430 domain-containing protein [Ruminococcus sp.]MDY4963151.1 DUF4430 domain-containing protein [Ruminococcus callidus]